MQLAFTEDPMGRGPGGEACRVAHEYLPSARGGAQPRRHIHGFPVPVAVSADSRPGVDCYAQRRKGGLPLDLLRDPQPEIDFLARVVATPHHRVADCLDLLAAVLR